MSVSQIESKPPVVTEKPLEKASEHARDRTRFARLVEPMGGSRIVSAAVGGMISTALWIAMFTVGLSVPSQPFRDGLFALSGGTPPVGAYPINGSLDALYALFIIAFAYTPTNLAMLCCLASLVGCLAYAATNSVETPVRAAKEEVLVSTNPRATTALVAASKDPKAVEDAATIPLRPTISAITWGFFIYLFLISGTLLAVENPFSSTTPDQYLRLAGTASLLAFVVGWRPELITRMVTQVGHARIAGQDEAGGKK